MSDLFEGHDDAPRGDRVKTWVAAALVLLLAAGALLAAGFLLLDRDRIEDELAAAEERIGLLEEAAEADADARAALEEELEETRDEVARSEAASLECRGAVVDAVEMWNDLVESLNAAARLDRERFERFAERAEERRREAVEALSRCREASQG